MLPIVIGAAVMYALLTSKPDTGFMLDETAPDGSLKRIRIQTSKQYAAEGAPTQKGLLRDLAGRLEAIGWGPVLLVTQDPTNATLFSALTRGKGAVRGAGLEIVASLAVDEPSTQNRPASNATDPGLLEDEMWALTEALNTETNERHLTGFAGTFEPHFPVASSLLRAKARLLESRSVAAPQATFLMLSEAMPGTSKMWKTLLFEKPSGHTNLTPPDQRPTRSEAARQVLLVKTLAYADNEKIPRDLLLCEVKRGACFSCESFQEGLMTLPPIVRQLAAQLLVSTPDCAIVSASAVAKTCPPQGDEGFISPSALQLALAEGKPVMSGVRSPTRVPYLLEAIARDSDRRDEQGMRARAMMEKAERAIERRRWIEWYRHK